MPLRRIVFWLHLVVGVVAGLVILVLAVTGALLAFEPQILAAADRASLPAVTAGVPLDPAALVAASLAATGGKATALVLTPKPVGTRNGPPSFPAAVIAREYPPACLRFSAGP